MDRPDELRHRSLSGHGCLHFFHRQGRVQELQQSKKAKQRLNRLRAVQPNGSQINSIDKSKKKHLIYADLAQCPLFCSSLAAPLYLGFFVGRARV